MRTRLFSAGLLLSLLCTVFPIQAVHAQESQPPAVYADAYRYLATGGLIPSAEPTDANDMITRAEALRVLLDSQERTWKRVTWYRDHRSSLPLYTDVPRTNWLSPYAEAAFEGAISTGFPDRTLRPQGTVPAEEAVVMVMRAYRKPGEPAAQDREWFAPLIRAAIRLNVIARPHAMAVGEPVTRGQFYDMLYRAAIVTRDNLASFPNPQPVAEAPAPEPGSAVSAGGAVAQQQVYEPATQDTAPVIVARPTSNPDEIQQFASNANFAVSIPSLGIQNLLVTHPEDSMSSQGLLAPLSQGVGHLFSYPGRGGKVMIYGHSSGYSWDVSKFTKIFRQVNKLKTGDRVYVTYNGQLYAYSVTGQETIAPNDASPFRGEGEELILYTCWPPNSTKQRLIVRAVPVETVAFR